MSFFKTLCLVCLPAMVGACGFQPLYSVSGTGSVFSDFSSVQVAPAKDRIGQLLSNELRQLLNVSSGVPRPQYRLVTTVRESTSSLAVKKSALATRAILTAQVSYNLVSLRTHRTVTSGNNDIAVGYNIYSAEYATIAAEKDARNRAIKELAQDIRLQLGTYFKNTSASAATN